MSRRLEYTNDMSRLPCGRNTGMDGCYGFGSQVSFRRTGLVHHDCEGRISHPFNTIRYPYLVKLYARLGLHRYNLLEGKNFQLDRLKSYNKNLSGGASCFYITLAACVPDSGSRQIFQVLVEERCLGVLDLIVSIARPQVTTKKKPFLRRHSEEVRLCSKAMYDRLPDWPSEIAFNDRKRFYMVTESELRSNDWISLYLELARCSHNRAIEDRNMSQLKIVQAAIETIDIETTEDVEPGLNAKSVVVYIAYEDLAKARIGESVDCRAIVRRVFNEPTGHWALLGNCWSGEYASPPSHPPSPPPSHDEQKRLLKRRLGVPKLWRLSDPRWLRAHKNRGFRSLRLRND